MGQWITQSSVATLLIVVPFMSIPFFRRNFGIDPLAFLVIYFAFVAIGTGAFMLWNGKVTSFAVNWQIIMVIALIGLTFGASANALLFRAMSTAPSPGYPVGIYSLAGAITFIVTIAMSFLAPKYFVTVPFDRARLIALILIPVAMMLLAGGEELFSGEKTTATKAGTQRALPALSESGD